MSQPIFINYYLINYPFKAQGTYTAVEKFPDKDISIGVRREGGGAREGICPTLESAKN